MTHGQYSYSNSDAGSPVYIILSSTLSVPAFHAVIYTDWILGLNNVTNTYVGNLILCTVLDSLGEISKLL